MTNIYPNPNRKKEKIIRQNKYFGGPLFFLNSFANIFNDIFTKRSIPLFSGTLNLLFVSARNKDC